MSEQNFTEIGRLHVQIQFDEKELEALKKEGTEIAQKLRVIADCLDEEQEAKSYGLHRDNKNELVSDHKSPGRTPMHTYGIPSDTDLKRVIKRTYELEQRISGNKVQIGRVADRERNRPE